MAMRSPSTTTASGRASRRQPLRGPECEAQGGTVVGRHHAVRVAGGAHSLDVGHLRRAGEADPPPGVVGAPAQVHVLVVHEVRLVEAPQLLERAAPGQEARARHPAGLGHHVAVGGARVVAPREGVLGVELRQQGVPGGVGEGGEAADRGVDVAGLGEDARPHQGPRRMGLECPAQGGRRAGVHDEVGVGDQDPLGRCRPARQRGQPPVDPGAETEVPPRLHDVHGRGGPVDQVRSERGGGAAGGAVLDHDDGGGAVVEERAHTALEQWPGVVVDHDGADRARHQWLSTPW